MEVVKNSRNAADRDQGIPPSSPERARSFEKEKNCKLSEHPRRGASFYNSLFTAEGERAVRPGSAGVPFLRYFLGK